MSHNRVRLTGPGSEAGFALFAVIIFAVIVGLSGLAFFSMASYEFKSAENQQRSSEAFYLADGAVELARGALLEDQTWRGPVPTTALGRGDYTLSIVDSVVNGSDVVVLRGAGYVDDSARQVETIAEVVPLLEKVPMFASGDINASGNLTVGGHVHVNGTANFGAYLKTGTYDEGYEIFPPPIYVGPDNFPNSTFYRVAITSRNPARAVAYQYDHVGGTWLYVDRDSMGASMINYDSAENSYTFDFASNKIRDFFNTTGNSLFKLNNSAGHDYVVVDFGHPDDSNQSISNVLLNNSDESWILEATIINARFEGEPDPGGSRRVESCGGWWRGGNVTFGNKVTFAPRGCVALVSNTLGPLKGNQPNAQGKLGTPTRPALTYVTGNIEGLKGALEVHGAIISLCDINTAGGPDVFYDPTFLECLPEGVLGSGGAGFMRFLEWREVGL